MTHVVIPHIALPFKFAKEADGSTTVNAVEQDSLDEVIACVNAICRYEVGERIEQPGFGIPDITFTSDHGHVSDLTNAINEWEPRAEVSIESVPDDVDALIRHITVSIGGAND